MRASSLVDAPFLTSPTNSFLHLVLVAGKDWMAVECRSVLNKTNFKFQTMR